MGPSRGKRQDAVRRELGRPAASRFGVGLRVSNVAAVSLEDTAARRELAQELGLTGNGDLGDFGFGDGDGQAFADELADLALPPEGESDE